MATVHKPGTDISAVQVELGMIVSTPDSDRRCDVSAVSVNVLTGEADLFDSAGRIFEVQPGQLVTVLGYFNLDAED